MAGFVRGVGPLVSNTTGGPLSVPTPARYRGDVVVILVVTAFPNDPAGLAVTSPEVFAPGMVQVAFTGDTRNRFRLLGADITASDTGAAYVLTRASGLDTGSDTIFAAKAYVIGGVDGGLASLQSISTSGPFTAANQSVPAVGSPGVNGLSVVFMGAVTPVVSSGPPSGYTTFTQESSAEGLGVGTTLFTSNPSGALPAAPAGVPAMGVNGRYAFLGLAFRSAVSASVATASAPAALLQLGCPDSYQVFITSYETADRVPIDVDAVGWSSIEWNRVLDEISTASVDIPDRFGGVQCCAKYGGLVPWRFGLRIERNDQLVWEGPITSVSRPSADAGALPYLRVEAQDALVRFTKRLATHALTLQYTNVDAGSVFSGILANAQYADPTANGFYFPYPTVSVGTGITREVVARNFEIAWDILKDLLDSALDGYVMNGSLYLFQPGLGWFSNAGAGDVLFKGPSDAYSGELLYGLFTESSYRERPGWSINGLNQANQAWEPGADVGEEGARRYWASVDTVGVGQAGILDVVDPSPLYRAADDGTIISDATFQRRADSLVQQRSRVPAVMEGGALSVDAPIDMDNLRPGAIWRLDYYDSCFGQLLQNVRLKRVTVSVSQGGDGLIETVAPTLFPVGHTRAIVPEAFEPVDPNAPVLPPVIVLPPADPDPGPPPSNVTLVTDPLASAATLDSPSVFAGPPPVVTEGFMEFSGATGNIVSTNDNAADPVGDITVVAKIAPASWTPSALQTVVGKYISSTNQRSWELRMETTGALSWQWSTNGTATALATSTDTTTLAALADNAVAYIAVAHDVNNGASGNTVKFSYSLNGTTWTALGTDVVTAATTNIFDSTSPIAVGAIQNGGLRPYAGRVHDVSVRSGVSGTATPGGSEVAGIRAVDIPADNGVTGAAAQTFTSASRSWSVLRTGSTTVDTLLVPAGSSSAPFLGGFFPIAADLQAAGTLSVRNTWATRGVNTFVRSSSDISTDPQAWSDAIEADGRFKQIRHPFGVVTTSGTNRGKWTSITDTDAGVTSLLAWTQKDEVDLNSAQVIYENVQSNYALMKAARPDVLIMVTTTGTMNQNDTRYYPANDPDGAASANAPWYNKYWLGCDIRAADRYPVHAGAAFSVFTDMCDRLNSWPTGTNVGKPWFAYVECADQDNGTAQPAPTAAQVRGHVWAAICKGARGILYFPENVIGTFVADNTPSDVATMMPIEHAKINTIAVALQGPIDPSGMTVTASQATLLKCWRRTATHAYYIVHNYSATAYTGVTVTITGATGTTADVIGESRTETITSGVMTDDFPAYTAHIYRVPL